MNGNPQASFDEIAIELGISKTRVHDIYRRAVVKLQRRHPLALKRLQQLATELDRERTARRSWAEHSKGGTA